MIKVFYLKITFTNKKKIFKLKNFKIASENFYHLDSSL